MTRIVVPALVYFASVFGVGFVLGVVRTSWVVPRLGTRAAELLELPLMIVAVFIAARWLGRRFPAVREPGAALQVGLAALACLVTTEIALGLAIRGGSVADVLLDRDPISGTAYYLSLVVFGLAPWMLARRA